MHHLLLLSRMLQLPIIIIKLVDDVCSCMTHDANTKIQIILICKMRREGEKVEEEAPLFRPVALPGGAREAESVAQAPAPIAGDSP